jgi:hypothetical protein
VLQKPVENAIEIVLRGESIVFAEQIAHRAVLAYQYQPPCRLQSPPASLPGSISRLATSTSSTCSQSVPSRERPSSWLQKSPSPSCPHSSVNNQHAPHWRGRLSTNSESRTPIPSATWSGSPGPQLNNANCSRRPRVLIEDLDGANPRRLLAVIDLPQIQHRAAAPPGRRRSAGSPRCSSSGALCRPSCAGCTSNT